MKRIAILLSMVMCLSLAVPASAQLSWGFKGGVNLSSASFNRDVFKSDNRAGFFIGPMIDFKLPVFGLGFDGAFMFSQRKFYYDGRGSQGVTEHGKIIQNGFDLPINLKWSIGLGDMLAVYAAAGPNFFFDFKASDRLFEKKKANVGINLGAGLRLLNHLQVGVNYNIPLGRSGDIRYSDIGDVFTGDATGVKTRTWQFSAAYLF